jgi:superfamily II DNA or RNA helicase
MQPQHHHHHLTRVSVNIQMKAYIRDGIYIPIKYIDDRVTDRLTKKFERDKYGKEAVCEKCEFFGERPCDICQNCPNYGGKITMFKEATLGEKRYMRTPYGDITSLKKIFGDDIKIIDKTEDRPMKKPFKFIGNLYDYQIPAVQAMRDTRCGILKSKPRTGKTVMAAAFVAEYAQKTVILAAQKDWLDNFYETFVGSDDEKPMTDMKKKRIGFPKTVEECEKYDVCLFTYQKFLKPKGRKMLKKIRKMFGVMIVDEVQTASAPEFASVINTFVTKRKYGLSGTPQRKDEQHWIGAKLIGKILYTTTADSLVPEIRVTWTALGGKMPTNWTYMVKKIEADPARLKLIAKQAIKDVKAGHLVLIPLQRIEVIKALAETINRLADEVIAGTFYGATKNRKDFIKEARAYRIKVVVGQFKLLSTGINIPRASCLYEVTPSSNLPKAEQRFNRVLTPYKGKPTGMIRYFLDDVDVRRNCIKKEFFQCLWPMFRPKMDAKTKEEFFGYLSRKRITKNVNDYVGSAI